MIHITDKFTRMFLRDGYVYTANDPLDPWKFAQDPTFLTFKVEFDFNGETNPADQFLKNPLAQEALLKSPTKFTESGKATNYSNFQFSESAEDYLYSIGAPNRLKYLRSFKNSLKKLQNETPWFFQTISGLADAYKHDGKNFRGDTVLTFDCLESVDLRISMLADLYRNASFDFVNMREVLPINMRTFSMKVHVLEMRNFNTTYGILADAYRSTDGTFQTTRPDSSNAISSQSVYGNDTTLFGDAANNILRNVTPPGINRGINGSDTSSNNFTVEQAFDAVSVITFEFGMCEFDFFSEAAPYLDSVTVADIQMASNRFKIKCGNVKRASQYSFYQFLIDEYSDDSKMSNKSSVSPGNISVPNRYYDGREAGEYEKKTEGFSVDSLSAEYIKMEKERVEGVQSYATNVFTQGVLGSLESAVSSLINDAQSNVNGAILGNVYQQNFNPYNAFQALSGFINPDLSTSSQGSATLPPPTISGGGFETLEVNTSITDIGDAPISVPTTITGGGFEPLVVTTSVEDDPFEALDVLTEISSLPTGEITLPSDISDLPDDVIEISGEISSSPFESLEVAGNINDSPMEPLATVNDVNGGGFEGLEVITDVSGEGLEPLTVSQDIISLASNTLEVSTEIQDSPLESISVDNVIADSPLESLETKNAIVGGGFETIAERESGIKDSPLEGAEVPSDIGEKNVGFESLEIEKDIEPKNVTFEVPEKLPGIHPDNVYKGDN